MRISRVARLLLLGAAAVMALAAAEDTSLRELTAVDNAVKAPARLLQEAAGVPHPDHLRMLKKKKHEEEDDDDDDEEEDEAPKKKKKAAANAAPAGPDNHKHAIDSSKRGEQPTPAAPAATTAAPAATTAAPAATTAAPAATTAAPAATTAAPAATTAAPAATTAAPAATTAAPVATTAAPAATTAAPAATTAAPAATTAAPAATTAAPAATTAAPAATTAAPAPSGTKAPVGDKRIKGNKNDGVIDHSSEGSAEIDKIDLSNKDKWISVYNDPPLLVIKASLYAFISYNNTQVCDSFNMTLNAVEQKPDGNGTFEYHVVTYVNCSKNGQDETPGRFILNFVPEGRRLLLTECGHREENEIVNWLKIKSEVPECMTPGERREFLAQPMKHIHADNGTTGGSVKPTITNFMARLENMGAQEVAIAGTATIALLAVVAVIVVFVMRKRKAQKDLERTIAGAKADHADEDDDKSSLTEDDDDKKKDKKSKEDEDED